MIDQDCERHETSLGYALRRTAKSKLPSSLDVPILDDAADEIDSLTAELTTERQARAALEQALVKAHACATLRDDGTCDGCFVSEALALPGFDTQEPEWFPNEGDRQWWREKHKVTRALLPGAGEAVDDLK